MALNRFMHPRNIYKNKTDLEALSNEFPELKKHLQNVSGKLVIDFRNPEALRELTIASLKKDFDLDVEIPLNHFIPTIPLRLNYILWLEDIFENNSEIIRGVDVETGASCLYPLLGAKKNKWEFLAFEKDLESLACARRNVVNNELTEKIKIVPQEDDTFMLNYICQESDQTFHFCMCHFNLSKSPSEAVDTIATNEKNSEDSEINFIQTIIKESIQLKTKIKVYTTMVNRKLNLKLAKNELKKYQLKFLTTEFCQGQIKRWGIAWTWDDNFKFPSIQRPTKPKQPLAIIFSRPCDLKNYTVEAYMGIIKQSLVELQIEFENLLENYNHGKIMMKAKQNTWSHQRRKRRLKLQQKEQDMDVPSAKREKTEKEDSCGQETVRSSDLKETSDYILECYLSLKHFTEDIVLELEYIRGNSYDLLHQVMQYFRNKFKI